MSFRETRSWNRNIPYSHPYPGSGTHVGAGIRHLPVDRLQTTVTQTFHTDENYNRTITPVSRPHLRGHLAGHVRTLPRSGLPGFLELVCRRHSWLPLRFRRRYLYLPIWCQLPVDRRRVERRPLRRSWLDRKSRRHPRHPTHRRQRQRRHQHRPDDLQREAREIDFRKPQRLSRRRARSQLSGCAIQFPVPKR